VRHDTLELGIRHHLEQARCRRDDSVLRVAAGREGVGRGVVDDVDLRHRETLRDREVLDDAVQAGVVTLLDRARAAQCDRLAPRSEVLNHHIDEGTDDRAGEDGPVAAAPDGIRDEGEHGDEDEEQQDDEDGVALVPRYGAIHSAPDARGQNWTRGGSAIAAESDTSKNSRSLKPRPRTKSVLGKTLILVLSSRTPPL